MIGTDTPEPTAVVMLPLVIAVALPVEYVPRKSVCYALSKSPSPISLRSGCKIRIFLP